MNDASFPRLAEYDEFGHHGAYAADMGPFYLRRRDGGGWRYAFPLDERHTNAAGISHGGALYSFADHLIGHTIVSGLGRGCATVKLKVEFQGASRPGQLLEAECEIVKATRTLAFVRARLFCGSHVVMTADGCFKLGGEFDLESLQPSATKVPDIPAPAIPEGFKPYSLQGGFAELYGPMLYRRGGEGDFVCAIATSGRHDNTTGATHGGVVFAFADDLIGRTVSATSRRFSATICLDMQYLAPAPLGSWLTGRAEVIAMDEDFAHVRTEVMDGDTPIASAMGIWRLFDRYG